MTKADAVALVTNMMISELIYRCRREIGVADYFDIAVLGYCADKVEQMLDPKRLFVKPSELLLKNCPKRCIERERRLPNGRSVITTTEQICWIASKAEGNTPMLAALNRAYTMALSWCSKAKNKKSYPLTIFNITDGEASNTDTNALLSISEKIKDIKTEDGNVLFINIHISNSTDSRTVIFPNSPQELPHNKYAQTLFDMSSIMPDVYDRTINEVRAECADAPFRGMSFNTSITDLISMMNIGSMSVNIK